MPRIYRSMRKAEDDKPIVDATGKRLGVRGTPVNGKQDVDLDDDGKVVLNDKGMSVAPSWRDLPYFLIPRRLKAISLGAKDSSELYCFAMGDRLFQDDPVAVGLELRCDSSTHGNVVPQLLVPLAEFQNDLANTRDQWIVDED